MKKRAFTLLISLFSALTGIAQQNDLPVFVADTDEYKCFRIPALITSPNGQLLAFAEGRVNGSADFGNVDIVMKRSADGGKTWSPLQVVADFGDLQAGNPAPVVDQCDPAFPYGRMFLFYNTGSNDEATINNGTGIRLCKYKTSVDNGQTWSAPVDITSQVHRPKQPDVDPAYIFSEDWRHYANTPGHAIQFQGGKFKGRIFVAANHFAGPQQKIRGYYAAHCYYSDDHGKTFKLGATVDLPGSNESMAVELSNSRLMLNSRHQHGSGDKRARVVTISNDGGATWEKPHFDERLIDPECQGSILGLGMREGRMVVAFCNPADTSRRDNLTLRISLDEGGTWTRNFPLAKAPDELQPRFAAYSDLVRLGPSTIGVLYEREDYSQIMFTPVTWK